MREISIFIDKSGDAGETSRFYLITLVFHDQNLDISNVVFLYERDLANRNMADIPMHLGPLMNGKDDYKGLPISDRKRYLSCFRIFADHMPFTYFTLAYEKAHFHDDPAKLLLRMKRDLTEFLFDNFEYLEQYETVKVYYDNGQSIVTEAIHDAIEYVLSKNAIIYKDASPRDYRLFQVADYICSLELVDIKFQCNAQSGSDEKFFGYYSSFKKNWLKKLRKKRLGGKG